MKRFEWTMLAGITLLLGACCEPALVGSTAVNLRPQETNNWCWAATTEMIADFLGTPTNQCDLANTRFGMTTCCTAEEQDGCPKNADCNSPGWTMFGELGFTFQDSVAPLSWGRLKRAIGCGQKPISYAYGPKSGGVGHVVVIYGYAEAGGQKFVFIKDPWAPCTGQDRVITYEEYSNSGTTDHWVSQFGFYRAS
ncbi:MAG: papain-like cysteine protease family protein [Bacteroidia bacterium]|nr:papain-like cysteine protease family protein [Bacteroidia bacterium]